MKLELVKVSIIRELAVLHDNGKAQAFKVFTDFDGRLLRYFHTKDATYLVYPNYILEERKPAECPPYHFPEERRFYSPKNVTKRWKTVIIEY